jgi:two-component system OmpR family sensor kinase
MPGILSAHVGEGDRYGMSDDHASSSTDADVTDAGGFFRELDTQLLVHELKSPLSLIEATTRTLLEHTARLGPLTERQERALKRILRGAVRGRSTVEQLLEVGRAEASQFADAELAPAEAVFRVVLDAVEGHDGTLADRLSAASDDSQRLAVLAEAGIHLTIAPGVERLRIVQDPVKFDLIVGNLLQNALRFRRQVLDVVVQQDGDRVVVTVRDDGPGIAPEHHAAVFERYRQVPANDGLERKGHGLGLAGALILARRLGGDIGLDSTPGQGATFRLMIPCQRG